MYYFRLQLYNFFFFSEELATKEYAPNFMQVLLTENRWIILETSNDHIN